MWHIQTINLMWLLPLIHQKDTFIPICFTMKTSLGVSKTHSLLARWGTRLGYVRCLHFIAFLSSSICCETSTSNLSVSTCSWDNSRSILASVKGNTKYNIYYIETNRFVRKHSELFFNFLILCLYWEILYRCEKMKLISLVNSGFSYRAHIHHSVTLKALQYSAARNVGQHSTM